MPGQPWGAPVPTLESRVSRNEAFARRMAHWRGEVARLREEEERLRLGGGAKAQEGPRGQGKKAAPGRGGWWGWDGSRGGKPSSWRTTRPSRRGRGSR